MSDVKRICPQCGDSSDLQMRHCPHCGFDLAGDLPMAQEQALSTALTKAAVPVLAGAAGLALRAGWRLLQSRLAQPSVQQAAEQVIKAPPARQPQYRPQTPAVRAKRTVRIRSSWAVGDARGVWRQGTSEHVIEFDD